MYLFPRRDWSSPPSTEALIVFWLRLLVKFCTDESWVALLLALLAVVPPSVLTWLASIRVRAFSARVCWEENPCSGSGTPRTTVWGPVCLTFRLSFAQFSFSKVIVLVHNFFYFSKRTSSLPSLGLFWKVRQRVWCFLLLASTTLLACCTPRSVR